MPQKPLIKGKKIDKKQAANKHGKSDRLTKKGKVAKAPKDAKAVALFEEAQEITKMINAKNEGNYAVKAETAGGRLKALKAGPPVLAPKSNKAKKSDEDTHAMDEDL